MQLLTHTVTDDYVLGWLFVVACRQALALERRSQRTVALPESQDGQQLEIVDPADQIAARKRLIDAGSVLERARLTDRQRRMLAMQAEGLTHKELSDRTGDSILTVQRQLLRVHHRIRQTREERESRSAAGSRTSG
ncbi:MAG: RNA polymerase sigma factor [Solirubrobacteraceae bacterium]